VSNRPLRRPLVSRLPAAGAAAVSALLLAACGGVAPSHSANLRWTDGACTSVLALKNELHRDATSLNLSFGPQARIRSALAEVRRFEHQLQALGLPPIERTRGRAQLRVPAAAPAADLALSALETQACRTLAGLPV
jgi:hypothetical protein